MSETPFVYVVMKCDWEDQWPIAVYATRADAEREAKRLEAAQKPEAEMKLSEVAYVYRVDAVEFHAQVSGD